MRHELSLVVETVDKFPFLFGGTFIEAGLLADGTAPERLFPFLFGGTFIEALPPARCSPAEPPTFPFLFGGTFIEAENAPTTPTPTPTFPFLFGGTFIEAVERAYRVRALSTDISLPFRRGFQ